MNNDSNKIFTKNLQKDLINQQNETRALKDMVKKLEHRINELGVAKK